MTLNEMENIARNMSEENATGHIPGIGISKQGKIICNTSPCQNSRSRRGWTVRVWWYYEGKKISRKNLELLV